MDTGTINVWVTKLVDLCSAVGGKIILALLIFIISVLGVPMASVITVLATCGLAIGMALQGALANLAGGIMLLVFRPFNIGDLISAAETEGIVKEMNLFYTVVNTLDNQRVTIPNGNLMAGNITNLTREDMRRVDLTFNVSGTDLENTRRIMLEQMQANEKVLDTPEAPASAAPCPPTTSFRTSRRPAGTSKRVRIL